MLFCEKCDAILQPKKVNGKVVPVCPECGTVYEDGEKHKISIVDDEIMQDPDKGKILIIEKDDNTVTGRSRKEMYCPNCKSIQLVEYWEIQTRSADESPTRFFRCVNCDYSWREYD